MLPPLPYQTLKQPNSRQFIEAIVKEVNGHVDCDHWALIKQADVPENVKVLPSVWSIRCECLTTGAISKHKARLNLHGGKQVYGVNYYDTYASISLGLPYSSSCVWTPLWLVTLTSRFRYGQSSSSNQDMYMELPTGIVVKGGNSTDHVLKLL